WPASRRHSLARLDLLRPSACGWPSASGRGKLGEGPSRSQTGAPGTNCAEWEHAARVSPPVPSARAGSPSRGKCSERPFLLAPPSPRSSAAISHSLRLSLNRVCPGCLLQFPLSPAETLLDLLPQDVSISLEVLLGVEDRKQQVRHQRPSWPNNLVSSWSESS